MDRLTADAGSSVGMLVPSFPASRPAPTSSRNDMPAGAPENLAALPSGASGKAHSSSVLLDDVSEQPSSAMGLAALRVQAQLAQVQLGEQPLPIANQSSRLILKLLGG